MRIFSNAYELMSEMGRELNSYGQIVKPKTYQNQVIDGNEEFITKEIICQQYCLTSMPDPDWLFVYTHTRKWADAEFQERVSGQPINPGKAWELNKEMWEQFLVRGKFDYTYAERMTKVYRYFPCSLTKLEALIELLKTDNDTRKAVLNIFSNKDTLHYSGDSRIPCSMYYSFLIRLNAKGEKQLNICYHQRSSDFVQHFGDDVYLAWRLMEYVAEKVGVKPGYLYHTIDSLHSYKKDWQLLQTSIDDSQQSSFH